MVTSTSLEFSEIEHDALTELVNISVSGAAVSLRSMVRREILLSVPTLDIVTRTTAASLLSERENQDLVAVCQDFRGNFSGRALFIFPRAGVLELIRAIAGDDMAFSDARESEEALAEIGNVILNGCLATMANILQERIIVALPEVLYGDGAALIEPPDRSIHDAIVLFISVNLALRGSPNYGYIAMLMDFLSLSALRVLVCQFIERVMTEDGLGESPNPVTMPNTQLLDG